MDKWIRNATPEKKAEDEALLKSFEDKESQLSTRMKQWNIAMDPLWMAKYEDPQVVKARLAVRPTGLDAAPMST